MFPLKLQFALWEGSSFPPRVVDLSGDSTAVILYSTAADTIWPTALELYGVTFRPFRQSRQ